MHNANHTLVVTHVNLKLIYEHKEYFPYNMLFNIFYFTHTTILHVHMSHVSGEEIEKFIILSLW